MITGEALADAILKTLETSGLPVAIMGAPLWLPSLVARQIIQQQAPMAIYVHCASYRLDLAIVSLAKL